MRSVRFLSWLAASLIALAPFHAVAQETQESVSVRDRPRPDYDALGMRLGGFDLNATLDLSATSTDNLFAVETGEVDDVIYHVAPYARLSSRWSRHALGVSAGADFASHSDFSSEDADSGFLRGFGRLDIGADTHLTGNAGWAHQVESRTDPDATLVGAPVEYDVTDYELGVQHDFNRFRVSVAAGHIEYSFDAPQQFRDSDEDNYTLRVESELTPRVAAFGQVRFDDRTYDNQPGLSSEGRTYLAGVNINFTELLRGEIGVGQFDREYDSGADNSGLAVYGNLEWYVTRLTTVSLFASRTGEDQGGVAVAPYTADRYGARVDHELMRNLIVSVGGEIVNRNYEVIDRNDDYSVAEAEAEYLLNRRVSLRGRFRHIEGESDGADAPPLRRSYDVNEATIGLRLKL